MARDSSFVGNPCDASTGNKLHVETDFVGGYGVPGFQRIYNSLAIRDDGLGTGWSHSYNKRVVLVGTTQLQYIGANGSVVLFSKSGADWIANADIKTKLTVSGGYYTFTDTDGSVEIFNPKGLPVSDTDASGLVTTYVFSSDGYLLSVTGPFGHKITFAWYGSSLTTATFPNGAWIKFAKDAKYNLVSATRADSAVPAGVVTQYLYEDTATPHSLTGIVDANGARYATYAYDATSGKAVSTQHAGGVGKFTLAYTGNQTVITDAVGNSQTLTFASNLGINLLVSRTDSSDGKTRTQTFDSANNLASRTDEEGRITHFTWDSQHRLLSRTDAATSAVERVTSYAYTSPTLDLPTTITEPGRTTTIAYNAANLPTALSVSDGTTTRAAAITYTAKGQVASFDGPRTDVSDVTTLTYWDCTTGAQCGQLKTLTNALGHVTSFDRYDGSGRLLQKTDPNGLVTTYAYNARGSVTSITETPALGTARTTSFTYDKEQQLLTASLPGGTVLTYAYDAAHQLASVTDNLGNKVAYAYDLKGNRTQTVVKDAGGTIQRQVDYTFNARNFVSSINAAGAITQVVSDAVGNPTAVTDPNGHASANTFDALDRLAQTVDRLGGTTRLAYDAQGYLAGVTAPNGAQTAYVTRGLGDPAQESGPDRGLVVRTFDTAGNALTRMDARGVTATSTYDALNRPTSRTYPAAGEDIAFTWDTCANGKGRLCGVADATGTWAYAYDGFGRVASVTWTTLGHAYTTTYAWNPDDTPASVTYPSGRQVSYTRNALGQITAITSAGQTIVSGRSYRPDGLLKGQTYGNGLVDARSYDLQGRLASWTTGSVDSRAYGYDANGNVTSIGANAFGFDWLDRLTAAPGQAFAYDPNGNRTADSAGTWSYASDSNRLVASPAGAVTLDAAGNTLSDRGGNRAFAYNQGGRLVSATVGGLLAGQYSYAFDGHRASKTAGGATTVFHYDLDGRLIAETDPSGTTLKEYLWDDDGRPLAQIAGGTITYLHPDHLGTPRFGTDSAHNIVWQWGDLSFGTGPPTGSVTVNLRYAGQYADAETGLFQNWNRTYDPTGGRYLESDPVGLLGGINTYSYVGGNPLSYIDQRGLCFGPAAFLFPACA